MKKLQKAGDVVLIVTIILVLTSLVALEFIGESKYFHGLCAVRYSWITLLFLPVAISCLVFGVFLKKHGEKYKSHYIVAVISVILLAGVGVLRFACKNIIFFDEKYVVYAENTTSISIPDDIKVAEKNVTSIIFAMLKF